MTSLEMLSCFARRDAGASFDERLERLFANLPVEDWHDAALLLVMKIEKSGKNNLRFFSVNVHAGSVNMKSENHKMTH